MLVEIHRKARQTDLDEDNNPSDDCLGWELFVGLDKFEDLNIESALCRCTSYPVREDVIEYRGVIVANIPRLGVNEYELARVAAGIAIGDEIVEKVLEPAER